MPVLWQSSQRPMYIRTVWVDGFRHAVLTHDDPYYLKSQNRRPRSSATCASKTKKRFKSNRIDDFDVDSFKHFNIVIRNNRVLRLDSSGVSKEINIEKLNLEDLDKESDLTDTEFIVKAAPQTLNVHDTARTRLEAFCLNMKTKANATERPEDDNDLSQRVLQWLDLAGKVELLNDNTERLTQPRHSWPQIQRNHTSIPKCKTANVTERIKENPTLMKSPKCTDSPLIYQNGDIDRYDYVSPSNTIENYARESRHAKHANDTHHAKIATRVENAINPKPKHQDIRINIAETRKKIADERNAVEKQYAELVTKKLIPEIKTNKKQVHIFIPELPKKPADLNSQYDVESTFSQSTA